MAWTERADPLVRARVEAVAAGFERVEVPWPDGVYPAFSREIVEIHADLYPDDRYDPGIAHKMERARAVTDEQVAAARAERERYRERIAALDVDLLITPTVPMVAPPVGIGDLALRERMIELTFPWNVTGSPALALPSGGAEDGLPASLQVIGRPGDDALVLAAGRRARNCGWVGKGRSTARPAGFGLGDHPALDLGVADRLPGLKGTPPFGECVVVDHPGAPERPGQRLTLPGCRVDAIAIPDQHATEHS